MNRTGDGREDRRAPHDPLGLASLLSAVEDAPPADAVTALAAQIREELDLSSLRLLILDYGGAQLVPLTSLPEDAPGHAVPLGSSPHGRCLRLQRPETVPGPGRAVTVLAPVTTRGEAIGVLEISLPEPPDVGTGRLLRGLAHLLAYVVVVNRRHSDHFEYGQRTRRFTLAAEIQRRLLPAAFTCEAGFATFAGWVEPAFQAGGDTFDYTQMQDALHVSLTDAMGHGVEAAMLATMLVGALRNERRAGGGLLEQAGRANAELFEHGTGVSRGNPDLVAPFATGILLRLVFGDGRVEVVNAGHLSPVLVRDGATTTTELDVDLPFGLFAGTSYRVQRLRLRPGDRLVLLSDGILEQRGMTPELVHDLLRRTATGHARDVVRGVTDLVLERGEDRLRDDATIACIDWHGGDGRGRRSTDDGADMVAGGDD